VCVEARDVLRVAVVVASIVAPRRAAADEPKDEKDIPVESLPVDPTAAPGQFEPAPPAFGAPGEIAISGSTGLGASYASYSGSQASSVSLWFDPAVDVFVARNVSLGLVAGASYSDSRGYGADNSVVETTTTSLSAGVRVGVNLPIASWLSFWPRLQLGYEWQQQSDQTGGTVSVANSPLGYPTTTRSGLWASLELPLTVHVAPHLFAGFGPSIFRDLSSAQGGPDVGGERTTLGMSLDIGGWFGGARATTAGEEPEVTPVRPFGSAHDFVISNAIVLAGSSTSYAGSKSTDKGLTLTPGSDFFVVDHFSVGVTLTGTYSGDTGIDSTTGNEVVFSHHAYSIAPRIGVDRPIGTHASFWPTLSVGIGEGSYVEDEGPNSDDYRDTFIWIALYAPVLVHVASHFFLGFGPSVSQDLSHSETFSNSSASPQNRLTSVSADLVVGGAF